MSTWIKFFTVVLLASNMTLLRAENNCKDNLSLSMGNETLCMSDYPGLLSTESGGKTLGDAAFSHSSLVFSASTAECGQATGFAWGAGSSTPNKSLDYCERDLRSRLSNVDIKRLGCECKVYFIPGSTRGNFKLLTPKPEFLKTLGIPLGNTQIALPTETTAPGGSDTNLSSQLATLEPNRISQQQVAAEAEQTRLAQLAKAASERLADQAKLLRERGEELALLRAQLLNARGKEAEKAPVNAVSASSSILGKIERLNGNPRKALVFGNNSYKAVSPLENAVADAQAIAKKLKTLGYSVTSALDAPRSKMLSTLRNFTYSVQGGDEVVFFYAGHGLELDGRNYLLPTDIRGEDPRQVQDDAIELQRVLSDMSDSRAKFTLAIIDACRDNPFKGNGRAIGGRGLAPTTAATGQMVIFSAGTGQQALDRLGERDKDPNGLFTRIFMQEIGQPNVPIDRVVKKVRKRVFQMAESVGHQQVPAIYDQVVGDFFFVQTK